MSSFTGLEIGKRGLLAQRLGLDITSNNISNVNTPGYSRRQPSMVQTDPMSYTQGFQGTGVVMDRLRTFRDEFFDREIRMSTARNATYASDEQIIQRLEAIFAEPSEMGLTEITADFFNAWEHLSMQPENIAMRENTINVAKTLTDRFNTTARQLDDTRKELYQSLNADIKTANRLIDRIAGLNNEISNNFSLKGSGAQTLIDEREKSLEDLSKLFSVNATRDEFGTVNVFANGINLITASTSSKIVLKENINAGSGEITLSLSVKNGSGIEHKLSSIDGEMPSLLKHFNITLDPNDSSGEFSISKSLNDFAAAIVKNVNDLTTGGYGLDDPEGLPPLRNFFDPAIGAATAHTISINAEIINDSRKIPLSDAANEPGNNNIARAIALLSSDSDFINGATPSDYFSGVIGRLGQMASDAVNGNMTSRLVNEQLLTQRESVIGVNLDEEAISLIKYQQAFEAASRIINTANEMLSTIIALGR